jgi:hypothetical protein
MQTLNWYNTESGFDYSTSNKERSTAYRPVGRGLHRTPLLSFFIHMNLYSTYVSHTHLIESRTPFVKKNPPLPEAAYGPATLVPKRQGLAVPAC